MRKISRVIAVGLLPFFLLGACGSEGNGPAGAPSPSTSSSSSTATPSQPAEESAAPSPRVLPKGRLKDALLSLSDMPAGYSQDPEEDARGNKYFCDYRPPAVEKDYVSRDFTKGGGMSSEILRFAFRQFASADAAKQSFDALVKVLNTCKSEVYEGSTLKYSPMAVAQLGDGSVGVKIDADGYTLVQNFVLVGPVLVSTGGGGLMNVNVDVVNDLLHKQIDRYMAAATG